MKIVDVSGARINACATFEYKGFTVSMSTIFMPGEVCLFKGAQIVRPAGAGNSETFVSVEAALAWIDSIVAGERMEASASLRC